MLHHYSVTVNLSGGKFKRFCLNIHVLGNLLAYNEEQW